MENLKRRERDACRGRILHGLGDKKGKREDFDQKAKLTKVGFNNGQKLSKVRRREMSIKSSSFYH